MKTTITTSEEGRCFRTSELKPAPRGTVPDFAVDLSATRQTIRGFGGAVTEAAASVYRSMDEGKRAETMRLLYSKEGLNYNWARLSLGSCDFSRRSYDYAKKADLSDFSLEPDRDIVAFLLDANKMRSLRLLASTWSPLAQWKTNGEKCHGGRLREECYGLEAEYVSLYVDAMKKKGLPIEALTVQNEPEAAQVWESCLYNGREEARLARRIHEKIPGVKLYAHDHNRDAIVRRAAEIFADPRDRSIFQGIAYHWYDGGDFRQLSLAHGLFPEKELLFTEGCVELLNLNRRDPSAAIGSFDGALRYAENYLQDLRNHSAGFIDWNVLLDRHGGPNHVGNLCEAPLMYENGVLSINPSYYAIKHFSHFIEEGARFLSLPEVSEVISGGAVNPDGSIILIFLNKCKGKPISFTFDRVTYQCYLNTNQITTIAFRKQGGFL